MSLLVWNCRGMGSNRAVQALRHLVKDLDPNIIFLSETKAGKHTMEKIRLAIGWKGVFIVDRRGYGGGLALLWTDEVEVTLKSYSTGHIDALIKRAGDTEGWYFTGFYGNPNVSLRGDSWELLRRIGQYRTEAWCCAGDFNEILAEHERRGGSGRRRAHMINFQEVLLDLQLMDLGYCGPKFTWRGKTVGEETTLERLDRACANGGWRNYFPTAKVMNIPDSKSDHLPIHIKLEAGEGEDEFRGGGRLFRFEKAWLGDLGCEEVVREGGMEDLGRGTSAPNDQKYCGGTSGSREVEEKNSEAKS